MNTKQKIIMIVISVAVGFCLGFILFHKQSRVGGLPSYANIGEATWDSAK